MQAGEVKVVGWVEDRTHPIQPKPHTFEFLRDVAHLRPRTSVIAAVTRVRHGRAGDPPLPSRQRIRLGEHAHHHFLGRGRSGELFRVSTLDLMNLPRTPRARSISRRISSVAIPTSPFRDN
jgi:asparaginyl-tRNA synthetase